MTPNSKLTFDLDLGYKGQAFDMTGDHKYLNNTSCDKAVTASHMLRVCSFIIHIFKNADNCTPLSYMVNLSKTT